MSTREMQRAVDAGAMAETEEIRQWLTAHNDLCHLTKNGMPVASASFTRKEIEVLRTLLDHAEENLFADMGAEEGEDPSYYQLDSQIADPALDLIRRIVGVDKKSS